MGRINSNNRIVVFSGANGELSCDDVKKLLASGVSTVIITMEELGCLVTTNEYCTNIPAMKIDEVDSVGAGDAFNLLGFNSPQLCCNKCEKRSKKNIKNYTISKLACFRGK